MDRIFLDLEIFGKRERQGHLDTLISSHLIDDLKALRPVVPSGRLLVRINPIHDGTEEEIDRVIANGADILMLPMYRDLNEVNRFCQAVDGRAKTCLLLETIGAMETLEASLHVPGVDEVHIGLNDLHLELGSQFMFEPLADGLVDRMARVLRQAGVPFGLGGVARAGEGLLPAELVLGEHVRLGSTAAILSRTFHRQVSSVAEMHTCMDFAGEIGLLRRAYASFKMLSEEKLAQNHEEVIRRVQAIKQSMRQS